MQSTSENRSIPENVKTKKHAEDLDLLSGVTANNNLKIKSAGMGWFQILNFPMAQYCC